MNGSGDSDGGRVFSKSRPSVMTILALPELAYPNLTFQGWPRITTHTNHSLRSARVGERTLFRVAAGPAYTLFPGYVIRQCGRYFSTVFVVRVLDQNSLLMTSELYWPVVVLPATSAILTAAVDRYNNSNLAGRRVAEF